MQLYEAFVDELEKAAVVGVPLGRTLKDPDLRKGFARLLRGVRGPFIRQSKGSLVSHPSSPEGARVMLAALRGGAKAVGEAGLEEHGLTSSLSRPAAEAATSLQIDRETRRLKNLAASGKVPAQSENRLLKRIRSHMSAVGQGWGVPQDM